MTAVSSQAIAAADVDGDGDLDLLFGTSGQPIDRNLLFLNEHGEFRDTTATHLPAKLYQTHAVSAADFDGDGDIDVLFGNSSADALLINDGTGRFRFELVRSHVESQ